MAPEVDLTTVQRAVGADDPWPGLAPYEEGDFDFFKGRNEEVSGVLRRILREDLTLLWGYSGLGKTSLLRAGLFPRLRQADVFPVYIRLRYERAAGATASDPEADAAMLREQCFAGIRHAASLWGYEVPPPGGSGTLWEYVRRATERFWGPGDRLVTPLLVFDQFEELFTHDRSRAVSEEGIRIFFADLSDALKGCSPAWLVRGGGDASQPGNVPGDDATVGPEPDYVYQPGVFKVLLSFREDFLARIASVQPLVGAIDHNYYRLEALSFAQAIAIVEEAGGHLLDDSQPGEKARICHRIVERVSVPAGAVADGSTPVDPALLSLFCAELNAARRHQQRAVIDRALVDSALTKAIIANFYNACMADVGARTREFVEERLVIANNRSRDSQAEASAVEAGVPPDEIDFLIDRRILRREETARGQRRLELTHDVLVEPALASREVRETERRLLAESQERELQRQREREAQEREIQARERAMLEEQLRLARELEQQARARQTAERQRDAAQQARLQRELILQAERTRRHWKYLGALTVAMAIAAALAVAAISQARELLARLRVQAAQSQLTTDPKLAAFFSALAAESAPERSRSTRSLAHLTLNRSVREASHLETTYPWSGATLAVSPNGDSLVLPGTDGTSVEIRRGTAFGEIERATARPGHTIAGAQFHAGGGDLALIYTNGALELLPEGSGKERVYLPPPPSQESGVAFVMAWAFDSAAGRLLLSRFAPPELPGDDGPRGLPRRWISQADLRTGTWVSELVLDSRAVADVVLAEDGRSYAVVDNAGTTTVHESTGGARLATQTFGPGVQVRMSRDGLHLAGIPGRLPGGPAPGDPPTTPTRGAAATLPVWRRSSDALTHLHLPGRGDVMTVAFSPDNRLLAVVQAPGIAQVWDLDTWDPQFVVPVPALGLVFSADSRELLTWDDRSAAQLWSTESGTPMFRLGGHREPVVAGAITSGAGPIVTLTGSALSVWSRGGMDTFIATGAGSMFERAGGRTLALSADGRRIAAGIGRQLLVADVARPGETRVIDELPEEIAGIAFSRDGHAIAVAMGSGGARIYPTTGPSAKPQHIAHAGGAITALAFVRNDDRIVYGVELDGGGAAVVSADRESGERIAVCRTPGRVLAMRAARNGRRVVIATDPGDTPGAAHGGSFGASRIGAGTTVLRLDLDECSGTRDLDGRRSDGPAPAPGPGKYAQYTGEKPDVVLHAESRPVADISGNLTAGVTVAISTQLTLWDLPDRQHTPTPFEDDVTAVALSPDGMLLAAGGRRGTIKLFSRAALNEPVVLRPVGRGVEALTISADGSHLAAIDSDGAITVYPIGVDELVSRARRIKNRIEDDECEALADFCFAARPTWRGLLEQVVSAVALMRGLK